MELQLAVAAIRPSIPKDKPLAERVAAALRYARENESSVFWMSHRVTDDLILRSALAAVMVEGDDDDKEMITRSLQPMKMLAAAMQGIPVDFSQLDTDNILPLVQMLNDSKKPADSPHD